MTERLLEVTGLHVEFRTPRAATVHAVNGLGYTLDRGETLAILGESGSGKSVAALAVMGILDSPPAHVTAGQVRFRGEDLLALPARRRRAVAGRHIAMVFQDALTALNPVLTIGVQIAEPLRVHLGFSRRDARARAVELLERVGIPAAARRADEYPHQLSGGMRQRAMIAVALALEPDVLIADEPTTALDVTVQAQVLRLLRELQDELSMGVVLITHDLGVVAQVADRIVVMYAGRAVEEAPAGPLYASPSHPYTRALLASTPRIDRRKGALVAPIEGSPASPDALPSGCAFHPRCPRAVARCRDEVPVAAAPATGRLSACHFASEVMAGVR